MRISLLSALALTPPITTIEYTNNGSSVHFQVFDPVAQIYRVGSDGAAFPYVFHDPSQTGGILTYLESASGQNTHRTLVNLAIWMPDSNWNTQQVGGILTEADQGVNPTGVLNRDGVVCWEESSSFSFINKHAIHMATFHPSIGWRIESNPLVCQLAFSAFHATANGVVVWRDINSFGNAIIYYSVYDPFARDWRTGSWISSLATTAVGNPSIANGKVTWTEGNNTTYTRTYEAGNGWRSGGNPVTRAFFVPSKTKINVPPAGGVWFIDMSMFANHPVKWNFQDGTGIFTVDSPYHVYTVPCDNSAAVQLAYYSPTAYSSWAVNIYRDANPPTGSIVINGGAETTNSFNVTLTLSASDTAPCSGSLTMRLSNDGTNWGAWEALALTKSWTLAAGFGTRTVYVQYQDGSGNVSSYSKNIVVKPPPPAITSVTSATGTVGQAFNYQITASNSSTRFAAAGLPAGLSVNIYNGWISGTPTATGTSFVSLSASNAGGTGPSTTLNLAINAATIPLVDALDGVGFTWSTGGGANWFGQGVVTYDGVDAAASGVVSHSQESWLQTTVTGPGRLSYWWKVASEGNLDFLRVSVDGTDVRAISGAVDWQPVVLALDTGVHTIRWRYVKDRTGSFGADRGWVDQVAFVSGPYDPSTYVDWRFTGANPNGSLASPFPTVAQGYAQVPNCGTMKIRAGSYAVAFNLTKCMRLEPYGGRVLLGRASPSGELADGSAVSGSTAGDGTNLGLMTSMFQDDGSFELLFNGVPGRYYQVFRSTDLATWELWKDFIPEEQSFSIFDPDAAYELKLFYKVVLP